MQLDPDPVARVDPEPVDPGHLTGVDPGDCRGEPVAVPGEAFERAGEVGADRAANRRPWDASSSSTRSSHQWSAWSLAAIASQGWGRICQRVRRAEEPFVETGEGGVRRSTTGAGAGAVELFGEAALVLGASALGEGPAARGPRTRRGAPSPVTRHRGAVPRPARRSRPVRAASRAMSAIPRTRTPWSTTQVGRRGVSHAGSLDVAGAERAPHGLGRSGSASHRGAAMALHDGSRDDPHRDLRLDLRQLGRALLPERRAPAQVAGVLRRAPRNGRAQREPLPLAPRHRIQRVARPAAVRASR